MKRISNKLLILFCFIFLSLLVGCKTETNRFTSLDDFENAKIGILTGSSHEKTVKEHFPNVEYVYYTNSADLVLGVEQGKIDGYVEDEPFLKAALWENRKVKPLNEIITTVQNGFIFPKTSEESIVKNQLNEFIEILINDGTIENLS